LVLADIYPAQPVSILLLAIGQLCWRVSVNYGRVNLKSLRKKNLEDEENVNL
jgi:hypothetical protein